MQNRCQDVEVNQHHNAALAVPRGGEVVPHLSSKTENAKLLASLADLKRTRPMNILRRRFLLISASAFAMSRPILGAILPDVDVAVIGAGMAGLAAAQRLRAGGLRAAVSEARTRICGREFTEHQRFGVPFNHGCAWTHADAANLFVQIADRFGFRENLDADQSRLFDKTGQMPETANLRLDAAYGRLQSMIEEVGRANLETPQSEAHSHSGAIERLARETVAHLQFGVEPDDVSTKDAFNRIPVSNLYLAPRGFGNLERGFGAGIDISLSTPVRNVHWHADAVWLHTPHGVGRARAALITA